MVASILRLLRPKQWSKNLLVFGAYVFTASFHSPDATLKTLLAFVAMCLVSSGIYVLNDLRDIERDRLHPVKRNRPLASGAVPLWVAWLLGPGLILGSAGLGYYLGPGTIALLGAYLGLQVLYNLWLKQVAVADVFCIATGFVLRAALGAAVLMANISSWLLFCTGALALMLGFAKRRQEFIAQGDHRSATRESLADYSRPALDALVILTAGGAAMCYVIYSIQSVTAREHPGIVATSVFVIYGICRYTMLIFSQDEGGEPADLLFRDPHLLATIVLFLASAVIGMMGHAVPLIEP